MSDSSSSQIAPTLSVNWEKKIYSLIIIIIILVQMKGNKSGDDANSEITANESGAYVAL